LFIDTSDKIVLWCCSDAIHPMGEVKVKAKVKVRG